MKQEEIAQQIITEFADIDLVTAPEVVRLMVQRSIDFWNTWSGYVSYTSIPYAGQNMVDLSAIETSIDVDIPIKVYPAVSENLPFSITPIWSMFGFDILDRLLSETAILWYYLQGLRVYLGKNFTWTWFKPNLMLNNVIADSNTLFIVYYKQIVAGEDIDEVRHRQVINWVTRYSKALVLVEEGRRLSRTSMMGVDVGGRDLVNDGKEEIDRLEKQLKDEAAIFLQRF